MPPTIYWAQMLGFALTLSAAAAWLLALAALAMLAAAAHGLWWKRYTGTIDLEMLSCQHKMHCNRQGNSLRNTFGRQITDLLCNSVSDRQVFTSSHAGSTKQVTHEFFCTASFKHCAPASGGPRRAHRPGL